MASFAPAPGRGLKRRVEQAKAQLESLAPYMRAELEQQLTVDHADQRVKSQRGSVVRKSK